MLEEVAPPKRKSRGPGKKPAMLCTSLRLPVHVMEYFNTRHSSTKQAAIRRVLTQYVESQLQNEGANNGTPT